MMARRLVEDRRFDVAALCWLSSTLLLAVATVVIAVRHGSDAFLGPRGFGPFDGWARLATVAQVTNYGFVITLVIGIAVAAIAPGPASRWALALGLAGALWTTFGGAARLGLVYHQIDSDEVGYGQAARISGIFGGLALFGIGAVLVVATWLLLRNRTEPETNTPTEELAGALS